MAAISDRRKTASSFRKAAMISPQEDYLSAKGAFGYQVSVTPEGQITAGGWEVLYRALGLADDGRRLLCRNL